MAAGGDQGAGGQGNAFQPPSMEKVRKQQQRLENILTSLGNDYASGITMEQLVPLFLEFHYPDSFKKIQKVIANREELMVDAKKMKSWQEVAMMDVIQVEGFLKKQFAGKDTIDGSDAVILFKDDHWMMNMDEETANDLNKFLEEKYGKELFDDVDVPMEETGNEDVKMQEDQMNNMTGQLGDDFAETDENFESAM